MAWGINQDGATNGITAPSVDSQIRLEKEVSTNALSINPETISLVESHGTGTKLGDPIEVEALTASFRSYTHKKSYCSLGSVKSNIGASIGSSRSLWSVIKVLLAIETSATSALIAPWRNTNELINFKDSPFYLSTELRNWEVKEG